MFRVGKNQRMASGVRKTPKSVSGSPEARKPGSQKPEAGSRSQKPEAELYLPPNPADCIDCREISAVEAMPCMRSLKSSALEAFSSAVS